MDMKLDIEKQLEQIGKVPKSIRLAVVCAMLAAVSVGYYAMSYQPKRQELARLQTNTQQLQRKLNNVRAVATNVGAFEKEVTDLERDLSKALKQLPNSKQFEDLLQDISTAGKKVGVQIKSIKRNPEVPHDFYAEVPFELELEGSYHELARFFERVARLPRIVNIGSLKVTVADEAKQATMLKVQGTATTFRFLSDEGRSAASVASPELRGRV